ncbi:MAG: hypothetical protein RLZZ156_2723 [Deinococcota bacterium]|jgi:hypothetical protein
MRLIWLLAIMLIGITFAQSAFKLVINGKTASSGWITLNGKAYVPIEALQKAGVVVKKTGNTYSLTLPKASSAKPVPSPTTAVPKPTTLTSTPIASVVSPPVVSPVAPTPTPNIPVTPTSPVIGANNATGTMKIVVNNANKPVLEGCVNQNLNNGVWMMRILNTAPLVQNGKAGYLVTLEYSNISANALSLFETGFSDGDGGATNFTLRLNNGATLASANADALFLYNLVQPNGKVTADIFFFSTESSLPSPQLFIVGQERRVSGFGVADASLRFKLDCR